MIDVFFTLFESLLQFFQLKLELPDGDLFVDLWLVLDFFGALTESQG